MFSAIYGNTIDQVGVAKILPSADVSSEKTQIGLGYGREAQPSHFNADGQPILSWQEWYRLLWEFKVTDWHHNHG